MRLAGTIGRAMVVAAAAAVVTIAGAPGMGGAAMARDAEQETYTVDSVHSSVVFRIEHMGIAYFYGRFNDPSGTYNIDVDNPGASFIDISVDAKKVDTGNERRDRHLRSPDFFNAEQFPTISFTARSAEKTGDNTLVMSGELTMLGVTKPAQANVTFIGKAESHQGFKSGFEAHFKINRSDFGMNYGVENGALGDEVSVFVAIEGRRN